jgi:tetratricopeptide (TPR) repeat protein
MRAVLISLFICLCLRAATPSQAELQALSSVMPDIQAGAWQQAEHKLLDALKQFPESAILSNALGMVYEKEGRIDLAIHAYEQATHWLPSFTAAQLHLATLLAGAGDCERANRIYLEASQGTSDSGALATAGLGLAQCKAYANAAEVFEKAHSLNPQSSATTFNLALARFENGDFNSSLEALESIPPGPEQERPEVLFLKGNLLKALNRPGATSVLSAACTNGPQEEYCDAAAIELIREERFLDAVALLQKSGATLSPSATALSTLGLAQFRLGRYQDAIGSYTKAIEKDKTLEAPREGFTFLLYMTGALERARAVAEEGLKAPHPGFYLFYLRALVLYRESRNLWPEAVSSLDEAIHSNPRFAPSYFLRGKIRMQQGTLNSALDDFTVAVRLDPTYSLPYYKMAQIFEQQGDRGRAEEARQKFTALGSLREEEVLAKQAQTQLLPSTR